MSTQFRVDTERITAASADIARLASDIESQVAALQGRLSGLQDAWTGSASVQFQGVLQQWQGTQRQVRESLDSIGRVLGAAGAGYADAEAQAVRMFS